jgi:DNA-binding MarR family transcriptional regulator
LGRLAARAGLEIEPAVCWLLLRMSRHPDYDVGQLAREPAIGSDRVQHLLNGMAEAGLVRIPAGGPKQPPVLTTAGRSAVDQLVAARRQGLGELLDGWSPDEHAELVALIRRLTAELLDDDHDALPHELGVSGERLPGRVNRDAFTS